jgi:hypothetical protein
MSNLRLAAGVVLGLAPLALLAATVPHVFSNGTVADADEVNANFAALTTAVTAIEDRLPPGEGVAAYGTRPATPAEGTIYFDTTTNNIEVFVGGTWRRTAAPETVVNADGNTCSDILANDSAAPSGQYVVDPDGPGGDDPFNTWCDMDTDGGGWTMVAYGHTGSTGTSSSNQNFRSLRCGGGSWDPDLRSGASASVNALAMVAQSTEIAFSINSGAINTGSMDAYSRAWKFTIPDPSAVHFRNHSYRGPNWGTGADQAGPCVPVTVTGIVGDSSTYNRYTLQNVLGTSWTDSYPTGYGAADNANCYNHNGGPFLTSIHTGSGNTGNGTTITECDTTGSLTYSHRGYYYPNSTGHTGGGAIWLR